MMFSDEELRLLSEDVKSRLSEKRFLHTLSVRKAAEKIGRCFDSVDISELSAAALLHDVTKELSYEEHIALIEGDRVILGDEDKETPAILHSFSAPALIKRDFPRFATESIISAVRNHTTGASGMSVFERIIFIADYVEDLRTYDSCVSVRNNLYTKISSKNSNEDNEFALNVAIFESLIYTENNVLKRGRKLNFRSLETKEYFKSLITS